MAVVSKFESPSEEYRALRELNLHTLLVGEQAHAVFFCLAQGNSLRSQGIFDKDLLIANRALTAKQNDTVLALVHDEFIVRVFDIQNRCLRSDTESPIPLDENVIIEAVISQVVRCLRPLVL